MQILTSFIPPITAASLHINHLIVVMVVERYVTFPLLTSHFLCVANLNIFHSNGFFTCINQLQGGKGAFNSASLVLPRPSRARYEAVLFAPGVTRSLVCTSCLRWFTRSLNRGSLAGLGWRRARGICHRRVPSSSLSPRLFLLDFKRHDFLRSLSSTYSSPSLSPPLSLSLFFLVVLLFCYF